MTSRWHIIASLVDKKSHGQLCLWRYLRQSSWPFSAVACVALTSQGHFWAGLPLGREGFEAVQATIPCRGTCRAHVPGATLLIEILKAVQVAMPSRSTCCIHVPGAALLVEILEAVKAIIFHHRWWCPFVPRAFIFAKIFEAVQVAVFCCNTRRALVPGAALLMEILEAGELAVFFLHPRRFQIIATNCWPGHPRHPRHPRSALAGDHHYWGKCIIHYYCWAPSLRCTDGARWIQTGNILLLAAFIQQVWTTVVSTLPMYDFLIALTYASRGHNASYSAYTDAVLRQ